MSFDNLITIGIIIYVIYSIKKVFSSGKKGEKSKKKSSGWAGKLTDFINEVKTEIEKANREAMAEKSTGSNGGDGDFWETIKEPDPVAPQPEPQTISQTLFYEPIEKKQPPVVDTEPEIPEIPEEGHRNYHGTHDEPAKLPIRRRRHDRCLDMKKADLKKAFVWSEILSKPVGLRD